MLIEKIKKSDFYKKHIASKKNQDFYFHSAFNGTLESKFYLASYDPGMGKTQSVKAFIQKWKAAGFSPDGSILIGVFRKEEIKDYIAGCSLDDADFAVITSDHKLNGYGRGMHDADNARILFTTQQMTRSRLAGKASFNSEKTFHYQGKPRSLRIWDESFLPGNPISLSVDILSSIILPLDAIFSKLATHLRDLMTETLRAKSGENIKIPAYFLELDRAIGCDPATTGLTDDQRNFLLSLRSTLGCQLIKAEDNNGKSALIGMSPALPGDIAPLFILDGSGRIKETYRLWEQTRKDELERLEPVRAKYGNLKIHHWNYAAGKTNLRNPAKRAKIVEHVVNAISTKAEEPWLIIAHKASRTVDIHRDIEAKLPKANLHFCHWGTHVATNRFRDIRNIVVIGAWNYPIYAYEALGKAAMGSTTALLERETIERIRQTEYQHNLLQAVSRGNVRNHVAGICGESHVYLINKSIADQGKLIKQTFPDCHVEAWEPEKSVTKGRTKEVADKLLELMSSSGGLVRKADLRDACGIEHSSQLSRIIKSDKFRHFIKENGIERRRYDFIYV